MSETHIDIEELIPQRMPIRMVSEWGGMTADGRSVTRYDVPHEGLLVDERGRLSTAGVVEHIAQSAAARMGYMLRKNGENIKLGFIGSVEKTRINRQPQRGETLRTTVRETGNVGQISMVEAVVEVEATGEEIAVGTLKIVLEA